MVPGITGITKFYHSTFLAVLEAKGQTRSEAARDLGISVSTLWKLLRLKTVPKPHTNRGKDLCEALERWSGIPAAALFPEAFFTKRFLEQEKTIRQERSFTLMMNGSRRELKKLLEFGGKDKVKKRRVRRKKK